ncbi:MAG: DUF3576 domain-containing protein [Pseudomonadota bacterium]
MRAAPVILSLCCMALMACGENLAAKPDPADQKTVGRPKRVLDDTSRQSVFGDEGIRFSSGGGLEAGSLGGVFGPDEGGERLPVNRFLWQASLDTLSFLPLSSTDPFTGVIATDWGASRDAPGERFKVTAYLLSGQLEASSLRVAVFREVLSEQGVWVPAAVDPATPRQLEDAILSRARQIRMAENGVSNTG